MDVGEQRWITRDGRRVLQWAAKREGVEQVEWCDVSPNPFHERPLMVRFPEGLAMADESYKPVAECYEPVAERLTPQVRWVVRDGERVLQQAVSLKRYTVRDMRYVDIEELKWRDVPVVEEDADALEVA